MKDPIGLDYKYEAQRRLHAKSKGDPVQYGIECRLAVQKLEKEFGFKANVKTPEGWTPPEITWPEDWDKPASTK